MLRGDVDRFYRALRQEYPDPPPGPVQRLDHVREIATYYARLTQEERHLMLAWAKKEESGIGMIPLALSAIPFFGLIVSSRLQELFNQLPIWQIFLFWLLFATFVLLGFYIHQRQKAYTALHIALLEQAIKAEENRMRHQATSGFPGSEARPEPRPEEARDQEPPAQESTIALPPAPGPH
ncbi:hypothetical protein J2Z79_001881 [Symbiobacterium terraclitae]|jgi:hypothetical protein|uniref:Uncharacterized protein n=1 Tax=Symbiobacterium terraclitae TaxID=557451 RepID=A0ABS4JSH7_9FIRM|nr:hypothetical protein [Symbiobacterium terraclitae]MBP2018470.1 hypothetical protein [Symbiobacterium terraclitae]